MGHYRKNLLTVFVNEFCNMRCIYCSLHSEPSKKPYRVIDIDFVKCGIDDFYTQTSSRGIRIFANGEATLSFQRVKEIVEYASIKAGSQLFIELQTNGYFSEEIAHWVTENVDMIWVSLDGTEEVQSKQRPTKTGSSSFPLIDKNIQIIQKSGKTKIGLRPTITNHNVDCQKDLIDYGKANNIVAIYAYPWASYYFHKDGKPDYIYFADRFLEASAYAETLGLYYGTVFTINFDEEVSINCRALLPAPHLTTDGFVSCCDMMNSGDSFFAEMFPELLYGKYNPEEKRINYYPDRIEKIRSRNIKNLEACLNCEALKHCAGGCIGSSMMTSGDFYGVNPEYCEVTKYLFTRMRHLVNIGYNSDIPLHP